MPDPPRLEEIDPAIDAALEEDRGRGDLTTDTTIPADAWARGRLLAKEVGVIAGLPVFTRVFERLDPTVRHARLVDDGGRIRPGEVLAEIEGPARILLVGERTALNFVQRMSGIATRTTRMVELAGGRARILDTRKTAPGLRVFERYAVRCGGGENHRFGLFDEAMIKNNHVDLAGRSLRELVEILHAERGGVHITAEARTEDEALAAAAGGADVVMLDNMEIGTMSRLCPRIRRAAPGPVEIEASGGIDEMNLAEVAGCGVDRISIGSITHSAPALDMSLCLEPVP